MENGGRGESAKGRGRGTDRKILNISSISESPGNNGLAGAHLSEDEANRPHIDTSGVLPGHRRQDLRCAVPQGDDLVGVGAQGHAEGTGEPKSASLEVSFAVDEEVLRLRSRCSTR